MKNRLAVLVAASLALLACKQEAECRPGTLFVTLTLNAAAETADQLHIVVTTDTRHEVTVAYTGGTKLQVSFPNDNYPAGTSADVTIEALKNGVVVAVATQKAYTLPKGCGALALAFGGNGDSDLSIGDLAGADQSGPDQSASADLEGADLVGVTPDDLTELPDLLVLLHANGDSCTMNSDCASDHCIDGYCCDSLCEGQCQACDVDGSHGTCVGVNGPPHGTRAACDGAGVCAGSCVSTTPNVCTYPGAAVSCRDQSCDAAVKTLAAVCDGAGACPGVSTFNCPSAACNGGKTDCLGGCTINGDCTDGSKPYCNLPEGVCKATKDEGETCAMGNECTSGFCVDGFCCDVACGGQCQACNLNTGGNKPGVCAKVTSGQPVTNAVTTRSACTGTGTCKGTCDGTSTTACGYPGMSTDCGTTCSCNNGTNNCACSGTCALAAKTPKTCDGAGACQTRAAVGCNGNVCNAGATDCGTCAIDNDCGTGRYCDAGNVCRVKKPNGNACSSVNGDHECANGHCVSGTCCATACAGTTPVCKADGSKCVCNGASCTGGLVCMGDACCDNSCPSCRTATSNNGCGNSCVANCGTSCQSGSCCVSESDPAFCARLGKNCGSVTAPDNCGIARTVSSCGSCGGVNTCGGGNPGTPNVCGCTAESNTAFCSRLGKTCLFSGTDNCGSPRNNVNCGTCGGANPDCGGDGLCHCFPDCQPTCMAYTETHCGTTCGATACMGSCSGCSSGTCTNKCCDNGSMGPQACSCLNVSDTCMLQ